MSTPAAGSLSIEITSGTLHDVFDGLMARRYDSGLVYAGYAERHPELLRLDQLLGSPDDAWLVLGRERTAGSGLQACGAGAIVEQIRRDGNIGRKVKRDFRRSRCKNKKLAAETQPRKRTGQPVRSGLVPHADGAPCDQIALLIAAPNKSETLLKPDDVPWISSAQSPCRNVPRTSTTKTRVTALLPATRSSIS